MPSTRTATCIRRPRHGGRGRLLPRYRAHQGHDHPRRRERVPLGGGELPLDHARVLDAQVVGIPDPKLGELVGAFVRVRPGYEDMTEDDVRAFAIPRIARYKVPKRVFFVDDFPMTRSIEGAEVQAARNGRRAGASRQVASRSFQGRARIPVRPSRMRQGEGAEDSLCGQTSRQLHLPVPLSPRSRYSPRFRRQFGHRLRHRMLLFSSHICGRVPATYVMAGEKRKRT